MTEITRRSLLRTGATATAAVVIGVRPWDPAAAGAAGAAATPLRRSDYAGLVGTDFAVADAPQAGVLRLASVADLAQPALRGSEDAFSLTFSGDTPLDSGIHGLTHPQLGTFDLFVSPVGTADRHRYEAVIDRSMVAPSTPPAGPAGTGSGADGSGADQPGDGAPGADGSDGAQPSNGADGSGGAQPRGAAGADGSGAAQPAGGGTARAVAAARTGGAATPAAASAKNRSVASTPSRAAAPSPARRAAILQRATVRRLGRGARVEIALRGSAQSVHVSLQRGGKSVAAGSHAVHERRATVALRSAHHLPAGSYVLVVSAVDGTGSTLVQRRRIAVR